MTKEQILRRALEMAAHSMIFVGQCPFGPVVCGIFQYCGCPKCLKAITAHFIRKATLESKKGGRGMTGICFNCKGIGKLQSAIQKEPIVCPICKGSGKDDFVDARFFTPKRKWWKIWRPK